VLVRMPNILAPPIVSPTAPPPDKGSAAITSPANKKGPPAARKKQHPVKGTRRFLLCGVI
ncbi:hypothetical protein, partial [Escherichia coli]|uniref:hypothetical protein n=1 Tax=Escherichia coli TaxID=562 RepID=UPI0032B461F8